MSGKSKARREAKAADRAARGNQRAQAELHRRWNIRVVDETARMNAGLADALYNQFVSDDTGRDKLDDLRAATATARDAARIDDEFLETIPPRDVYEPHCVMTWREQMAGMDDMGGVDTALTRGDAT